MGSFNIEGSVSAEVTVPGEVAYSSVKQRMSLSIGQIIEADTEEDARDQALGLLGKLSEDVKLSLVANAPGTTFYTDEHGVGQIGVGEQAVQKPAAKAVAQAAVEGDPAPLPQEAGFTKALAHGKDRYTIQWNGAAVSVFDNRETKTGNQPDFSIPDLKPKGGFWLVNKDGSNNTAAYAILKQVEAAVPA